MTEPNDPEGDVSPNPDRTEIQPQAEIAASKELSVPKKVEQHASAPKIPGYILTKALGRGAFAEVWKAWQVRTHKWVAVKVFTQRTGVNWIFLQREVERLIKLDKHPNIVSLLDADLTGEPAYYVMDYLESGSLDQFVNPAKPAPVEKAAKWMEEIAEALAYVHSKGLIHCDLKPANILLDEGGHVRVADFGQSRIVTDSAGALGTLFYMAPEQALVAKDGEQVQPDVRWDIFGLGTTMYAILTGKIPHETGHAELIRKASSLEERLKLYREAVLTEPLTVDRELYGDKVDEDLAAIVVKCAKAEAAGRHLTVAAVLLDLTARREQRPVSPLAYERKYRIKKFVQRNRALVGLSAAAALALIAAGTQIVQKNVALKRAGTSIVLKNRDLQKAGAEVELKNAKLQQQLADSYATQGGIYLKGGDFAAAASYYNESNRLALSHRARANALAALEEMSSPLQVWVHDGPVLAIAFSPDGKTVLTGSEDHTARLWDALSGEPLGKSMRHEFSVNAVAFSPDGNTVLTGSMDKTARLWDARTGEPKGKVMSHDLSVDAVAFSPDAKTVLTGSWDKTARIWDARTGEPLSKAMRHEHWVVSVAYSPDGKTVLTRSEDKTARLWDARTGAPLAKMMHPGSTVESAAYSPDGKTVATGSMDNTARLWDGRTGEPLGKAMRHEASVRAVVFSPDGKTVLTGSWDKTARIWDERTGKPLGKVMRHESGVGAVAFSPDGKTVLSGSDDKTARLWDARTGEPLGKVLRHEEAVKSVAFSPDGKTVLTGSDDKTARLWDARTGEPLGKMKPHLPVLAVVFSPDGKTVLTVDVRNTARLADARTGAALGKMLPHVSLHAVAFSPDGKTVFTGSDENTARFWNARTGEPLSKELRLEEPVKAVGFSPDGKTALTSGAKTARLWDARTAEPIGAGIRHKHTSMIGPQLAIAFSPDSGTVLTNSSFKTVRLWDPRSGEPLGKEMDHDGPVHAVAFSPDGRTVITGSWDKTSRLWDVRTCEPTGKVMRHEGSVEAVAFSPDGNSILTGSDDKTARLWNAQTGEPMGKVMHHERRVGVVAFSPDGKTVLTVDGDAHLWDARTGESIGKILRGVLAAAFSPDGKAVLVHNYHANRLWDVNWLSEMVTVDNLQLRTEVRSKMRIGARGEMETIPIKEWQFLYMKLRAQNLTGVEVVPPLPDQSTPAGFVKSVTRHFNVFTEQFPASDRFLELIEKLYGNLMLDLEPFSPWASDQKVSIFLFKNKDTYRRVTGRPSWSGGAASVAKRKVYVYESEELPSMLTNQLCTVYYDGFYLGGHEDPLWLSQGMSTFIQVERGGGAPKWLSGNIRMLERGGGSTIEELMSVTNMKDLSDDKVRLWYAQSYAIVRFLNRAQYKASFYKFSEHLREGKEPAQALSLAYGMSFKELDFAWRANLAKNAVFNPSRNVR